MLTTKTSPHIDIISRAGNLAPSTKRKYISEIERLLAAGVDPRNREALAAYAAGLSQSSRAFLKASLAILFADTITSIKAGATAGNLSEVQAALYNWFMDSVNLNTMMNKYDQLGDLKSVAGVSESLMNHTDKTLEMLQKYCKVAEK